MKLFNSQSENNHFTITCTIIDFMTSKEQTFPYCPFTHYVISVATCVKSWSVQRRFREFENLNKELSKKYKNLPSLPRKTIFSCRKSIVEERKRVLEEYLNSILNNVNLYETQNLLEFIELDKEIIPLIKKKSLSLIEFTKVSISEDEHLLNRKHKSKSVDINEKITFNQSKESNKILIDNFLKSLEGSNEDTSAKIENFWNKLRLKWPEFDINDILKLFYGNGSKLRGLIFHSGNNIENNSLGAEKCLNLLNKLILFEYNPDCEKYINCLKMSNSEHIITLNLNLHIKNNKVLVKEDCFNIIKNLVSGDKGNKNLETILTNEHIELYNFWLKMTETI
jgi:hypothetical protein